MRPNNYNLEDKLVLRDNSDRKKNYRIGGVDLQGYWQ